MTTTTDNLRDAGVSRASVWTTRPFGVTSERHELRESTSVRAKRGAAKTVYVTACHDLILSGPHSHRSATAAVTCPACIAASAK